MAAGGDNDIALVLFQHSLIFVFDDRCADRGLLDVVEAELLESTTHRLDSRSLVIGNEGGGEADNYGVAALNKNARLFCAVNDLFRVLRANNEAMAAKDALVTDNVSLVSRETDRLNGTVTNTFITVFAI